MPKVTRTPIRLTAWETARLGPEVTAGWSIVSEAVGPLGEAIALLARADDAPRVLGAVHGAGGIRVGLSRTTRPWPARVVVVVDGVPIVTEVGELSLAHPLIQPLPGGRFLVVGARCRCRDGIGERNAVVLEADGAVQSEMTFGDGIEAVQTSVGGSIWASYFDEGVIGNNGWGYPGGPRPIGCSGLVRFGLDDAVQWEYRPPAGHEPILDCYALNVHGKIVWLYYYTGFTLARVERGRVTGWHVSSTGARAVAVDGNRVLLVGGDGDQADRVLLGRLGDEAIEALVPAVIDVPSGRQWTEMKGVGRGCVLHLHREGVWCAVDLRHLTLGARIHSNPR